MVPGGLFRAGAGKQRTMQQRHLQFAGVIGYRNGEETGILLSTCTKSIPSYAANLASPSRRQWNRSADIAKAIRGPLDDSAAYVITYWPSGSTKVTRGSSQPPPPPAPRS